MIRKIFLAVFLLYSALWLIVAFMLKQEISDFLDKDSDIAVFSYQDIKISGFPNKWQLTIVTPVAEVNSENAVQIFSSASFDIAFNLGLNVIKLMPNLETFVEVKTNDVPVLYKVILSSTPKIKCKLHYPIFLGAKSTIDTMSIVVSNIGISAEQELASINDMTLNMKFKKSSISNIVTINTSGTYEGLEALLGFDFMQFVLDSEIEYDVNAGDKIFLSRVTIDEMNIVVDDEVALGITGNMSFTKDERSPEAQFDVMLQNYPELIEFLWPDSARLAKQDIKRLVDKVMGSEAQDAEFVITMSNKGFMFNDIDVMDFYKKHAN